MKRHSYTYSTLRYIHDIATQEFFTVGVAVFSNEQRVLKFRFRRNPGLAGEVLNSATLKNFRALMRTVLSRSKDISRAFDGNLLPQNKHSTLEEYLLDFFPKDDSALQWSETRHGLSSDVSAIADHLFIRYCSKYDRVKTNGGITDKDALSRFHNKLTARRMDTYFSEKSIQGKNDEVKFHFAWKNGIWHCIEPVSFDLSDEEAIRDKAHKRVGAIVGVRDTSEAFAVYYVLTPPANPNLTEAFTKASGILANAPISEIEVYQEGNEASLLDKLKNQITAENALSTNQHG